MYSHQNEVPQEFGKNVEKIPQMYFPVFARVRIQAPHVFAQKFVAQDFFPASIGFVPGGNSENFKLGNSNKKKSTRTRGLL